MTHHSLKFITPCNTSRQRPVVMTDGGVLSGLYAYHLLPFATISMGEVRRTPTATESDT